MEKLQAPCEYMVPFNHPFTVDVLSDVMCCGVNNLTFASSPDADNQYISF